MDALVEDIRTNGIKQPILIAEDYLVFDGARRIVAAQRLKMTHVPVIFCKDWATLKQALTAAQAAGGTYPMNWMEYRDLWERVFKPLHETHRRGRAAATRRRNTALLLERQAESYNYSGFTQDLAAIYNVTPASIKMLRDSLRRIDMLAAKPQYVSFRDGIHQILIDANVNGRHLNHGRTLKTIVHRLQIGTYSEEEALKDFETKISLNDPERTARFGRRVRNLLDPEAPVVALATIKNFAELLDQVANQATQLRNFHDSERHRRAYKKICAQILGSTQKIYRLRRRLESVLDAPTTIEEIPGIEEN